MDRATATWAILAVSAITFAVTVWQGDRMLEWYPVPLKGIAGRIVLGLGFTIAAITFGIVAINIYGHFVASRPDSAANIYLVVGAGLAALLSVAAVVVHMVMKRGPVMAWIILNFLWGLGYGWLMPALLTP